MWISVRARGSGCPKCGDERSGMARRKPKPRRSLADTHPHLVDQFVRNLTSPGNGPDRLSYGSNDSTRLLLEELGLTTYLMTTGSRGYHVVVPLRREHAFDETREFAHRVADTLAGREPEALTVEQRKDDRGTRIFVDYLRNAYAQTAVAPYAVRARRGAHPLPRRCPGKNWTPPRLGSTRSTRSIACGTGKTHGRASPGTRDRWPLLAVLSTEFAHDPPYAPELSAVDTFPRSSPSRRSSRASGSPRTSSSRSRRSTPGSSNSATRTRLTGRSTGISTSRSTRPPGARYCCR